MKDSHSLYIFTNGVTETQQCRIAQTNFNDIFVGIFISEQTGNQKPMLVFFDFIFKEIGEVKRAQTIIVGSDILGGVNAHISTCWFNVRDKKNMTAIEPEYEIHDLAELEYIVD